MSTHLFCQFRTWDRLSFFLSSPFGFSLGTAATPLLQDKFLPLITKDSTWPQPGIPIYLSQGGHQGSEPSGGTARMAEQD